mmetsp:Transcript_77254/g.174761  ORF Transcript_77254/g.174761 Transcript_77254/m.174761 type:complete len:278 (+) Transcript_77254:208-1041(+)
MLLAVGPVTVVPPVIGPDESPKAGLPVSHVLAPVDPAVGPGVDAITVYHAALPLAPELALVGAKVHTGATDAVPSPLAMVHGAIHPPVDARAVLLAGLKFAFVVAALLPGLHTVAVLEVVDPLPGVARDLLVVCVVVVDAHAVGHVAPPLTTVDVAVSVNKATHALGTIPHPLPLVHSSVLPPLHTSPVPHVATPLPRVGAAAAERVRWALLHSSPARCRKCQQLFEVLVEVRLAQESPTVAPQAPAGLAGVLAALKLSGPGEAWQVGAAADCLAFG